MNGFILVFFWGAQGQIQYGAVVTPELIVPPAASQSALDKILLQSWAAGKGSGMVTPAREITGSSHPLRNSKSPGAVPGMVGGIVIKQ